MSTDVNLTLGLPPRLREILGGLGVTELGYLDGVTAGTTTASRALVVGTGKNVNILTMASAIGSVQGYFAALQATGTVLFTGASASMRTAYFAAIGSSGAVSGTAITATQSVTTGSMTASGTAQLNGASSHVNTLYAAGIGSSGAVSGTTFTGNTVTVGNVSASGTTTSSAITATSGTIARLYGNPTIGTTNYAAATPTASGVVAAGTVSGSGSVVITPGLSATQVVASLNAAPLYASGAAYSVAVTAINGASATISFYDMAGGAASANASAYWVAFGL